MSNGPLNRPKLPGIPGIDTFKGHTFHTSRWDYGYTGGDTNGNLHKLGDKRVAIIGTGATAVQCVPFSPSTPSNCTSSSARRRRSTSAATVRPTPNGSRRWSPDGRSIGWKISTRWSRAASSREDLVNDGWTDIIRNLGGLLMARNKGSEISMQEVMRLAEIADFKKMNQIRARVDSIVKDKRTAESLKPWYRQFCKRPTFNDEYLPAFNRPNVSWWIRWAAASIASRRRALVFDGVEYEVDCIIFATGFEVGTAYTRRAGFEVYGRDGKALSENWANGLKTLHGFCSAGFPNCFHMGVTQNALTANFPHMLEEQARHITELIKHAKSQEARCIEPTPEAEAEWVATIKAKAMNNQDFLEACTPGYYNNEGKPQKGFGLAGELYGGGPVEFHELIKRWREDGEMKGLRFS